MPETPQTSPAPDAVTLRIAAAPERIYAIVTDIERMGRLSPECTGGRWLGDASGPAVGAQFKGTNKRGIARWSTTNRIVAADPGRAFAFETQQSGVRWTYRFDADGDDTIVTEERERFKARTMVATVFTRFALGGVEDHDEEMRAGMRATLERLKAVAEETEGEAT